jgi:hypothetical protein
MLKTVKTSHGDFRIRLSELDAEQEIANKIARRLGCSHATYSHDGGRVWAVSCGILDTRSLVLSVKHKVLVYS